MNKAKAAKENLELEKKVRGVRLQRALEAKRKFECEILSKRLFHS